MLCHASFFVAALLAVSQDPPKELLGSWRCETGPIQFLQFQEKKLAFYAEANGQKQLAFFPVVYEPGKIRANMMGKKTVWTFDVKGDELKLTIQAVPNPAEGTMSCRRLGQTPEELQVKTLEMGKPDKLSGEAIDKIRKELADRIKTDQAVRTDPKRHGEMGKVDAENTAYLIQLIKVVGWIDAERFGALPSNNAFLIVQHSGNLSLMTAALPLIRKDVLAKKLDPQPYALLYDRLMVFTGGKQRYGTQLSQNEKGELVLWGLEDKARVEEFRKEIGLFPLAQYLKMFGDKKVLFEEE
jgi:hypothetical protein